MIMTIEHSGIQITIDAIKSKLIYMEVAKFTDAESSGAAFAAKNVHFRTNNFMKKKR